MGYYFVLTQCGQCGRPFSCNPHLVPSLNGVGFCRGCIETANPKRAANGLAPIVPHPQAYEPADESEMG